jgi:hypothetical protein
LALNPDSLQDTIYREDVFPENVFPENVFPKGDIYVDWKKRRTAFVGKQVPKRPF